MLIVSGGKSKKPHRGGMFGSMSLLRSWSLIRFDNYKHAAPLGLSLIRCQWRFQINQQRTEFIRGLIVIEPEGFDRFDQIGQFDDSGGFDQKCVGSSAISLVDIASLAG